MDGHHGEALSASLLPERTSNPGFIGASQPRMFDHRLGAGTDLCSPVQQAARRPFHVGAVDHRQVLGQRRMPVPESTAAWTLQLMLHHPRSRSGVPVKGAGSISRAASRWLPSSFLNGR